MTTGRRRFWTWFATGVLVVLIAIFANLLADRLRMRWDLTEDQRFTLPDAAKKVAGEIDDRLLITAYISEPLPSYLSHVPHTLRDMLLEFRAASEDLLEFEFVDPRGDDELIQRLKQSQIQAVSLADVEEGKRSVGDYFLWLQFNYKDQQEPYNLMAMGQVLGDRETLLAALPYQIAARLVKVTHPDATVGIVAEKKKPQPLVQGQEPEPTAGLNSFREGVKSHFADIRDVVLKHGIPVPGEVETLLVYRPEELGERGLYELDQFLMRGNQVVLLLDNYAMGDVDRLKEFLSGAQRGMVQARKLDHGLTDWLAHYGIKTRPEGFVLDDKQCGSTVQTRQERVPGGIRIKNVRVPMPGCVIARELDKDKEQTGDFTERANTFSGLGAVGMIYPVPMEVDASAMERHPDARVEELIRTSPDAWVGEPTGGRVSLLGDKEPGPDAERRRWTLVAATHGIFESYYSGKERPKRRAADGKELPEPHNAFDRLERSSAPGHLVVFTDADFLSDLWIGMNRRTNPGALAFVLNSKDTLQASIRTINGLVNTLDAITLGDELVEIRRPLLTDRSLDEEAIQEERASIIRWTVGFAPLVLVGFGLLLWLVRLVVARAPSPRRFQVEETFLPEEQRKREEVSQEVPR